MAVHDGHTFEMNWLRGDLIPKLHDQLLQCLVAHRGFHCPELSSARPLECTLPALRLAWDAGFMHCECDVRLAADGEIILLHDASPERLALGSADGSLARELSAQALQAFSLKQPGAQLTSLVSALRAAQESGGRLVVELKEDEGIGEAVAKLLAHETSILLLPACCLVMSFEVEQLAGFSSEFARQSQAAIEEEGPTRPPVLLLTCMPQENLEPKYQTLDFGSPQLLTETEAWLSRPDLNLDGFYVEWTPELTGKHRETFRQLCLRCTVGVWQHYGQLDCVHEASRLLELGAAFCNTDLPKGFAG
eukprot:TRINITY_DN52460_c0_g1_i1.p1 TRINITY_DN52460_c0_g1~~TRINITY_DN52460_c0_g1_i1.p1  ORF type:complete len:323 (+),score=65.71 TRINITY_DN52460_c0_g1_i1:54-971(+)